MGKTACRKQKQTHSQVHSERFRHFKVFKTFYSKTGRETATAHHGMFEPPDTVRAGRTTSETKKEALDASVHGDFLVGKIIKTRVLGTQELWIKTSTDFIASFEGQQVF